jgi:ribosome assembly protein 1
VIHLIDSPGHVDFSFEVTSSLLLCDGALLVVDAVEGMCARTHSILREAYAHELVPVLVINKIDRLCTDLCLTPTEAYVRLRGLVESINAAAAAMIISYSVNSSTNTSTSMDSTNPSQPQELQPSPRQEEGDNGYFNFDPNRGNVVFASALHGWGFTVPSLARSLFRSKMVPIKPPVMRQYLFGDFKYHSDTSKITKWKNQSSDVPMFAEFALAPLWDIYEGVSGSAAAMGIASEIFVDGRKAAANDSQAKDTTQRVDTKIRADTPGMDQVIAALQMGDTTGSSVPESFGCPKTIELMQKMMNRTGASAEESILRAVLRRYRPLSEAVLSSVCEHCPSPAVASSTIRNRALALRQPNPPISTAFTNIQSAVRNCDVLDNVPTVAHVCKFMATDRASVTDPELAASFQSDEEGGGQGSNDIIMGLARVLSGTLRSKDVEYYMYGPRFNKSDTLQKQSIRLYLLMGSSFVRVESVPAGHICAVYNLENLHLKTVTLCDRPDAMPLRGFDQGVRPLVKVSVEPASVAGKSWKCART